METFTLGNFVLRKMDWQEYDKAYDANTQEQYGEEVAQIAWVEQYATQEHTEASMVAMSEENMLIFKDGTFAYTSRGIVCRANFWNCISIILSMEEL